MKKVLPVVIVILVVVAIVALGKFTAKKVPSLTITNFKECASAGYPIMESYPRQCKYNEQTFIENIIPVNKGGCYVGGCSAQICSDQKNMVSDCMYRAEYACYKTAICERQPEGECGWTDTPTLTQCLSANAPTGRVASGYIAGHVNIGPNCPVERADTPCPPSPEAYSSREVIVYENNGVSIKQKGKIDASGNYKIAIGPGNYFVQISPAGIGAGEKKPVTVKPTQISIVDFDIDTGIR